jgi:LuxR family transcriptional regulator, maltose regulon positive regulatory protein
MIDQNRLLLKTKLHQPLLPSILVERERLLVWLDQSLDHPLTLVVAPAGYGKTTLVGTWLNRQAASPVDNPTFLPAAWLSLDENDSDLGTFLRYFIAALQTIYKEACPETQALLRAGQQPPETVFYTTFFNELADLPGECILVLDDYQFIRGMAVHNLLSELTQHWPTSLHLVLISRIDPVFPLSKLRAKGMIREIRVQDLRFTPQETAAYLRQSQNANLSPSAMHLLEERFEGWPAGLHLAALSLRSTGSQERIVTALSSENANVTEYLVDEVLSNLFPAILSFLLRTSILNRFSTSLCDVVFEQIDPEWNTNACLEWIERCELFIIPLDNSRDWYRYHHLFQELLQKRLYAEMSPDQVGNLHCRASAWFEAHGLIDEALHHALAAGDLDLAARQMIAGLREVINREDRQTLERWLSLLPEEMIQCNPGLLMIRAWALQFAWRLRTQIQVVQQVERFLDSGESEALQGNDPQNLRAQTLLTRAQQAYFSNQNTRATELCRQILSLLPKSWIFVRGGAMIYLSLSMQANGQVKEAERMLLDEYQSYSDKADTYALFLLESLGFIYLNTCQFDQVNRITQMLREWSLRSGMNLMKNWADWLLGVVCFQRNQLEEAERYFTQIYENRYIAQMSPYRDAVAGLAFIHQIKGKTAEAWQMVESISQFDLEVSGSEDNRTGSLRARLMLLQGDLDGARQWANMFIGPPPDQALFWLEEPQVTRARILATAGVDADMQPSCRGNHSTNK